MTGELHLDAASVEGVAKRVVELLRGETATDAGTPAPSRELVGAAEVARRFGVARSYVYAHGAELGAVRLGDGPRPRLRFDVATVAEQLTPCYASRGSAPAAKPMPKPKTPRRRRRTTGAERPLLPIRPPGAAR